MGTGSAGKSTPLMLAGQGRAIEGAELYIGRPTRWPERIKDNVGVAFGLALNVDEDSGEDGAPAPMIQNIPVLEAFGRWPRLDELPGTVVSVENDVLWDAWYGNDAPPLTANRLEFGNWSGNAIHVRWSARWDRGRDEPGILTFDGAAALSGIRLNIFEDEPIEALLTEIWGVDALRHFEVTRTPPMPRPANLRRPRGMPETASYDLWPRFLGLKPA